MTALLPLSRSYRVWEARTVDDALREFATTVSTPAIGFCYRPSDARWFRLGADGTVTGPAATTFDLTAVFELRAFTGMHELRWLNESAGTGRGVLVSDDGSGVTPPTYHRLMWGAVVDQSDGWATLSAARIGTIKVPVDSPTSLIGRRIWLRAVEYEAEDEHGNVAVVDERITGLEAGPPEEGHDD